MRNFIIEFLNGLSLLIIVAFTVIGAIVGIMAYGVMVGILFALGVFVFTAIPMGMFLVLCSINDKLDK